MKRLTVPATAPLVTIELTDLSTVFEMQFSTADSRDGKGKPLTGVICASVDIAFRGACVSFFGR